MSLIDLLNRKVFSFTNGFNMSPFFFNRIQVRRIRGKKEKGMMIFSNFLLNVLSLMKTSVIKHNNGFFWNLLDQDIFGPSIKNIRVNIGIDDR